MSHSSWTQYHNNYTRQFFLTQCLISVVIHDKKKTWNLRLNIIVIAQRIRRSGTYDKQQQANKVLQLQDLGMEKF